MAVSDPLVTTAWLSDRLRTGEVRVVDGSWHMPGSGRSGREEYLQAHIPGAVFFDIDAVADTTRGLPHMLPSPEAFAAAAGSLGLGRDHMIVVYDTLGVFSAARVWWTLRAMKYDKVAVLDGGLRQWIAERRPIEGGDVSPRSVEVDPAFDPQFVCDLDGVAARLRSGEAQILDARPSLRFEGKAPEPRPGLRGGHMPGALNLPFDQVVEPDGRLKSAEDLRDVFNGAGVDLKTPIVTTCGSGVTAAVLTLALARLGVEPSAVYDGSWSEWGSRDDTPVETSP